MAYKKHWNDFFYNFDADKNGYISTEDAEVGMRNFATWMKLQPGTPQYQKGADAYNHFLRSFIAATDKNGDGKVTKEEYDSAVEGLVAAGKAGIPQWWRDAAALLFKTIDTNGNGEISLEEFQDYAKNLSTKYTEDDIKKAYEWAKAQIGKKIDSDGFMDLIWIWGSTVEVHPELDIIFGYWK